MPGQIEDRKEEKAENYDEEMGNDGKTHLLHRTGSNQLRAADSRLMAPPYYGAQGVAPKDA